MKKVVYFTLFYILISSCKHELESPRWEVNMITPIAHASMNISNLITETDPGNLAINVNSDSLISLVFSDDLIGINLDTIVKIDAITDEQTHTIDSASFEDVTITDTATIGQAINEIPFGTTLFPNGSTSNIPAIPNIANEDTINVNASEYFQTMTLYEGMLIIEFINQYPTDISNVSLSLINSTNQSLISTFNFALIPSGSSISDSTSIAGLTIDENILGILHNMDINASNGPVLINYEDAIITKITVANIGIVEATAIFPEQQLTEQLREHSFEMGNAQIKEIGIKSGNVKINVLSTLPNGKMIYNIPSLKKNGIGFTSGDLIVPEATNTNLTTFEFDFEGYVLDLTGEEGRAGGDTINTIYTEAYTFIDSTGELVTINQADSFYSYIEFDLTPEYAIGYLGQETMTINEQKTIEIFNNISSGTISLENATTSISLNNYIGAEANITFHDINTTNSSTGQVISAPPNIINNTYTIDRAYLSANGGPISPSRTDISIDAEEMIEILPDEMNIEATFSINPNGQQNTDGFLYADYPIEASLDLEVPLNLIANDLTFSKIIDADLSPDTDLEIDELYITLTNGMPISCLLELILLDEYNNIIDTLITQTQINAANTHNNIVTTPSETIITIKEISFEDVKKIKVMSVFSTSSITEHISIYSYYNLDISLSAKFRKVIGE